MHSTEHTYAVILAGGGGTRLWPKSRNATPKQFLKLLGDQTMIQVTADRLTKLVDWDHIIVVTNEKYREDVKKQLPEIPEENIIAEPQKKDTAMAMLVGSLYAYSMDNEAIVINAASDHVVPREEEYVRVMHAAAHTAEKDNYLVTVGITPTFPSVGFGYIKIGDELEKVARGLSVFRVSSFTEKPNEPTARAFISTGRYFWNANMYVWKVSTLIDAFKKYMPEMFEQTKRLCELKNQEFHDALPSIYDQVESISIDYAISEKADNLVLIPGDFGWNDVGDWKVVHELGKKDLSGNVIAGDGHEVHTLTVGSQNNLIHTNGRLVALVGVDDMIVIDTDEILMIAPKSKSQDVKKLVDRLKEEKREDYL